MPEETTSDHDRKWKLSSEIQSSEMGQALTNIGNILAT